MESINQRSPITDLVIELHKLKAIQKDENASKFKKDLANKKYEKLMKRLSFGKVPDKTKQYRITIDPEIQAMVDRTNADLAAEQNNV